MSGSQIQQATASGAPEKMMKQMEAIIQSMTPLERHKPDVINGSRKPRIAAGAGVQIQDINRLLKQHAQMEKMMKAMWQPVPTQKRVLELNPNNVFVQNMLEEFKKDLKSEKLKDMMMYAYEQAILLEWWELEDIKWFVSRVNKYMK